MRRIHFLAVVALILSLLIFAYGQLPRSSPQTAQTSTKARLSQPLKAKKILVRELPKAVEGVVLVNGAFKLKPGYKFVPQPNGTVTVALQRVQGAGTGVTGTFDCFCAKEGGGSCSATTVGGTISCGKSKTTPCSDECILRTTIGGSKTRLAIY